MNNYAIPIEIALGYIAIIFIALLVGFWMGRMVLFGEPMELVKPREPEIFEDPDEDYFSEAMPEDEPEERVSTI